MHLLRAALCCKIVLQSMDDFLWNCALEPDLNSRLDIVPDYEDDMKHFCTNNLHLKQVESVYEACAMLHSCDSSISIEILESRNNGVLDIIGGELWEGALLLCAFILSRSELFTSQSVLELGSGVGLPGLLLSALKILHQDQGSVTLSDNDPRVVTTLNQAIENQFKLYSTEQQPKMVKDQNYYNFTQIDTRLLDWSIFMDCTEADFYIGSPHPAAVALEETRKGSQLIMGCELCYAPYHARCLAELLKQYLSRGYCEKVVIIQMRDREGFPELLTHLDKYSIAYQIEEISQELYDAAQWISCTSSTRAPPPAASASRSSYHCLDTEDCTRKTFTFPQELLNKEAQSRARVADTLLRSAKENFVILSIG